MIVSNLSLQERSERFDKTEVTIVGWVRSNRDQKDFGFLVVNDGSTFASIQVVYSTKIANFEATKALRAGCAVEVKGIVVLTPNQNQPYEIQAILVTLVGASEADYPIQPKRHTREFLRTVAHLRTRTNLFNAVFRVRSKVAHLIHKFFQKNNFIYLHSPIITGNDGEGAGQTFQLTTLDLDKLPRTAEQEIDYKDDFFGAKATLAVTGQLEAEAFALSFGKTYTFGPTFRAENSNTLTHASEFWMIEPEMAFTNLTGDMRIIEKMLKWVINEYRKECPDELAFFEQYVSPGLIERLNQTYEKRFARITHAEAIDLLLQSGVQFENKPCHGQDIAREHERYLTDVAFKGPVFVTDWPKEIKAFYMKVNRGNKTVAAVDLLVPGAGELVGGSQREDDLQKLEKRMQELNMDVKALDWYLDLRRYGGCPHAGFGMGFERLIMYLTGVENIRDVLPFPRTPKNIAF
jgi:asparaginyl-tRNA synthetase